MKKFTATAGMAAVGLAGLAGANAQSFYGLAPQLSPQELSKSYSVSLALRGFYDDNYLTQSSNLADETFGYEISPAVALNFPLEQTYIGLSYVYSFRYFEARRGSDGKDDQSHIFNLLLNHAFSGRYKLALSDSFVIAQEPEVLDPNPTITNPIRTIGDNIRNQVSINFTAGLTPVLDLVLGYANTYWDFEEDGFVGSRSALLDRLEHLFSVNLRWQALPSTVGVVGYQYGFVDYTGDDPAFSDGINLIPADYRNNNSHYFFVGADHTFTPQLIGSARVGLQVTQYPDDPADRSSEYNPYVEVSGTWNYNPGSFLQAGLRHSRNQTDASQALDQESTTLFGSVNHQLSPALTLSVVGQAQRSSFNGGPADSDSDLFFLAGVNLAYRINQFLAAEVGYNYDRLDSDVVGRGYSRNRVYLGLRGTY
jgi:hypothetical protein